MIIGSQTLVCLSLVCLFACLSKVFSYAVTSTLTLHESEAKTTMLVSYMDPAYETV